MTPLLLSMRPRYADLVFAGEKRVELRRRITPTVIDREVFVYASSPARVIRGGFWVDEVRIGSPESVWSDVGGATGLTKTEFDAYFEGCGAAHALRVVGVWAFDPPLRIDDVRRALPGFRAPRSWRYVREEEIEWLGHNSTLGRVCAAAVALNLTARRAGMDLS